MSKLYLIELTSTRTGKGLGYVMQVKRSNSSYPQTFTTWAQAELECSRLRGHLRRRWRDYRVVEKLEKAV